ncbi:MAG: hypothetical protein HY850_01640 [Betaproteobacteria bacterium]|nr:hypothetical protein [Betaproteobacteria bacterium]
MHTRLAVPLIIGTLALATPAFATGYEGYADLLADAPWFDGARSTIDYQATIVVEDVAVWSGIDNNEADGLMWIQGGWGRRAGEDAKIYWEYTDEDGTYRIGYDQAPGASEAYEQSRNGVNVEWKHGATIYKTEAWNKFDAIEFRKVQYGAEMANPPDDHTPGTAGNKNKCVASAARKAGGAFAFTGLAYELSDAASGNVEKYGDADSGNFRTWDSRN